MMAQSLPVTVNCMIMVTCVVLLPESQDQK